MARLPAPPTLTHDLSDQLAGLKVLEEFLELVFHGTVSLRNIRAQSLLALAFPWNLPSGPPAEWRVLGSEPAALSQTSPGGLRSPASGSLCLGWTQGTHAACVAWGRPGPSLSLAHLP